MIALDPQKSEKDQVRQGPASRSMQHAVMGKDNNGESQKGLEATSWLWDGRESDSWLTMMDCGEALPLEPFPPFHPFSTKYQ